MKPLLAVLSTPTRPYPFAAEVELLCYCARTQLSPETIERLQTLMATDLNWALILSLAQCHRVVPLLLQTLRKLKSAPVPPPVLNELQTLASRHTFDNLNNLAELVHIIDLLKQHHISAIPFKGPTLGLNLYGDIALRPFSDLDILVAPDTFLKARQILMEHGHYQSREADDFVSPEQAIAFISAWPECSLGHPVRHTWIDLHQELIGGNFFTYPFEFETLSQRLVPVSQVPQLQTLEVEDLLLYLCTHGAKSLWKRLIWICDVAELIAKHPHLDWDSVWLKAQTAKLERILLLGLWLAHQMLDAPLPERMMQAIARDREVDRLAQQVYQHFLSAKGGWKREFTPEKLIFRYRTLSAPEEKVRYWLRYVNRHGLAPVRRCIRPTANDRRFFELPRNLYVLYYVVRPIRLLTLTFFRLKRATQNA
jgi:hypothetical protein